MRKTIGTFAILSLFSIGVVQAETSIESSQVSLHIGENVVVCGKVHEIKIFSKGIYINIGNPYPKQHIAFLIWNNDLQKFTTKFSEMNILQGSRVCAQGVIESYKNTLQIKIINSKNLHQKNS